LSHEKPEDEQKDWPNCVFYDDIKCPVRKEIRSTRALDEMFKPLPKFDDRQAAMQVGRDMMKGVVEAMGFEWSFLAGFCHICPFKVRIDRAVLAKSLEREMAVMKVVKEELKKEGVLPE